MPSKRPKISAYVSKVVKDRLTEFSKERQVSESQAVTIILAEYFQIEEELKQDSAQVTVGGVTLARMESLEKQLSNLQFLVDQQFQELNGRLRGINKVDSQVNKDAEALMDIVPEPQDKSTSQLNLLGELLEQVELKPVSGTKLSKLRFGLGKSSVSSAKAENSTEKFTEWTKSKDPDGIGWKAVDKPTKGYLPVEELSEDQIKKLQRWIKENNL